MKRSTITVLVALALAVGVFDAWYFLGGTSSDTPPAPEAKPEMTGPNPDDFLSAESTVQTVDGIGEQDRSTLFPWLDPANWPLVRNRATLEGRLRGDLMSVDLVQAIDTAEVADLSTTVILWNPQQPMALLAGRAVGIGDRIGEYLVDSISLRSVALVRADGKGPRMTIELGPEVPDEEETEEDRSGRGVLPEPEDGPPLPRVLLSEMFARDPLKESDE